MTKQARIVLAAMAVVLGAFITACTQTDASSLLGDGDSAATANGSDPITTTTADGGIVATTKDGLPCDVEKIFRDHCQTCHGDTPSFGASTSLTSWNDLTKQMPDGSKLFDSVGDHVHGATPSMPPSPNTKLTDAEIATFDNWVKAGAPKSAESCTGAAAVQGVKPLSCKADTVLKATKPFTMTPQTPQDQYMCFGVDVNIPKKRHVIGLAPKVDNTKIVHHILLFQTQTAESAEPFPCEAFGSSAWKLVAGWAPGGDNLELPKEAGFPEEAGTTHWVLQVHYNNTNAKEGTDNSGYELCTTEDLRPNDAGVLAFGSINFSIPPRAERTISCDYQLGPQFQGVNVFNASPHMHTRGVAMTTERLAGGTGAPETIFSQPNFSFEAQANYPLSKQLNPGDVMRTHCSWKNPGDTTVGFGEGTADEMCFNFMGYYPKIPDTTILGVPVFTWVTPAELALCSNEK